MKYWFVSYSFVGKNTISFGNAFLSSDFNFIRLRDVASAIKQNYNLSDIVILSYKEITKEEHEFQKGETP